MPNIEVVNHHEYVSNGFVFIWEGGQYIEVSRLLGEPFTVINVWDAEDGEPTIGTDTFEQRCDEWINNQYTKE